MKNLFKWALVLPLIASISIAGCKKEEDNDPIPTTTPSPVDGKYLIASGSSDEAEVDVKVYADHALLSGQNRVMYVGYNKLYTMVYKKGTMEQIPEAHVTYNMTMTMMSGMTHKCPIEQPTSTAPDNGLFIGAVVPIMSSASMGNWTMEVHVHNHSNGKEGHASMPVEVMDPEDALVYSFISPEDQSPYFVTLVEPHMPEVGINTCEVTIHKRETMMDFPAVESFMVEIDPQMPTMGHGSPNNVNPVHMQMGHYVGQVNFSMGGFWQINMKIKDASGKMLDETHAFDLNVPAM